MDVNGNNIEQQSKDDKQVLPVTEKEIIEKAHEQAEIGIEKDPELTSQPEQGDDLDEGELAQLEGGRVKGL